MSALQTVEAALKAHPDLTVHDRREEFDHPESINDYWWGLAQSVSFAVYTTMRGATRGKMQQYIDSLDLGARDILGGDVVTYKTTIHVGRLMFDEVIGRELLVPVLQITDPDIVLPPEYDANRRELVARGCGTVTKHLTRRIVVEIFPSKTAIQRVFGRSKRQLSPA